MLFIIAAVTEMSPALWSEAQVKGSKTLFSDLVTSLPSSLALVQGKGRSHDWRKKTKRKTWRTKIWGPLLRQDWWWFYMLSEKSIMHVMKSSLSGFLCSYVCATVFEWHRGVSLSAMPASRGPMLVVGPHTPVLLPFAVHCVPQTCTQKINEFRVDTNTLKTPLPPPSSLSVIYVSDPPPVLRERTAPATNHTHPLKCHLRVPQPGFVVCVCHATLLVTHKRVPTYLALGERYPWVQGETASVHTVASVIFSPQVEEIWKTILWNMALKHAGKNPK